MAYARCVWKCWRCARRSGPARRAPVNHVRSTPDRGPALAAVKPGLLAIDQQADQHADAGRDADGRPRMLVHVVIGGPRSLLALFDDDDLDVGRLFLRLLQACE